MTSHPTRRVAIWTHQRTTSTALLQCFAGRENIKTFMEPYAVPFIEEWKHCLEDNPTYVNSRYKEVKTMLESDYPGSTLIVFKDMADFIVGRYDKIPEGYTHTFLIREPTQSISSFWRATINTGRTSFPRRYSYGSIKPVLDLYDYFAKQNQPCIIIDAHDLSHFPEIVLKQFCQKIGVTFSDDMLRWKSQNIGDWDPFLKYRKECNIWFGSALESTSFHPLPTKDTPIDLSVIPEKYISALEESKPIYDVLFAKRIKPF
uniref:Branched-chain-amino-acid aminotransferase-like protein 1-like n=1 Tax=Saccoglossus kowalevskii TaxID=10224 RepID=A0ABM0M382_SACKO|nr:PREDICTED: branched-chain-amino-acid aminotransferase-like protein 1-like [Saccoglossus kowalevskii]